MPDPTAAMNEALTALNVLLLALNLALTYNYYRNTTSPSPYAKMATRRSHVLPMINGEPMPLEYLDLLLVNGGPGVARDVEWSLEDREEGRTIGAGKLPALAPREEIIVKGGLEKGAAGGQAGSAQNVRYVVTLKYSVASSWASGPSGCACGSTLAPAGRTWTTNDATGPAIPTIITAGGYGLNSAVKANPASSTRLHQGNYP